ncbi:hypothetical protein [Streptomyces pseudogriseolus]|uniref:hypothetical protein n=1 Tax=Streptomyces pseudogriseolus TaxID=36817 RepID=UPI00364700DF
MSDVLRPIETAAPADLAKPPLTLVPDLPADPAGDLPLIPDWTRTGEGRKSAARRAARRARRAGRRWLTRQRTDRGHAAQIKRGTRRTHEWVVGFQGVHVQAAAHQAHTATREARDAARRARYTLMPGQRDKARQAADKAQTAAMAAVNAHRQAKAQVRRGRIFRGSIAYGTPLLVDTAALVEFGGLGLAGGIFTTLSVAAWIGRKPLTSETWDHERRSIGDGDAMTEPMLNRAYRDAKVIAADQELKLVTPCGFGPDAWEVEFDLPPGVPTAKATGAVAALASGFGVKAQQVSQTPGDREGRIRLRVSLKVPFTGEPVRGPLLDCESFDLWDAVPMGISERGEIITTTWFEKTALFGGEPGSGKTSMANGLLLAASLDATARIFGADGKAGADLLPFEDIAEMLDTEGDPEALLEILRHVWEVVLPECKQVAREHGVRRFSRALAAKDPRVRFTVLAIDEWASYLGSADPKTAKEIDRLLRLIVQQGRAYGVVVLASTQKPDSEAVPTGVRDIISTRWAGRCLTPEASDTILGKGRATAGHNAQRILKQQRGVGFYQTGESADPVLMRAFYYDDGEKTGVDEVALILERAYKLRAEAGTLPGSGPSLSDQLRERGADGEILAVLVDTFAAYGDEFDWLPGSVLLDALRAAGIEVTPERLAALVVRPEADKKKTWEGNRVSGYGRALVFKTAQKLLERP